MSLSKLKGVVFIFIPIILLCTSAHPDIRESELERYSTSILKKFIEDNRKYKSSINEYLNGVVVGNNTGMKLVDKLGLFVYNSRKSGVKLNRTGFYQSGENDFLLLLVFSDENNEEYILHLEYSFENRKKVCTLKNIYFSIVFGDKKEQVEKFFRYR